MDPVTGLDSHYLNNRQVAGLAALEGAVGVGGEQADALVVISVTIS